MAAGLVFVSAAPHTSSPRSACSPISTTSPTALAPDVAYLRAVGRRETQHRGADWGAFLPFERYDEGARLLLAKQALKVCYLPQGA